MVKINKTQFEKYGKLFLEKIQDFTASNYGKSKMSVEERSQADSMASILSLPIEKENPLALLLATLIYEWLPGHDQIKDEVYSYTGGLTVEQ